MGNYYGNMFGWGLGGGLMMIVFWVFVVLLIVWLVKGTHIGDNSESRGSKSPLDILKERYAKGELDKKEYDEKKKDLIG